MLKIHKKYFTPYSRRTFIACGYFWTSSRDSAGRPIHGYEGWTQCLDRTEEAFSFDELELFVAAPVRLFSIG